MSASNLGYTLSSDGTYYIVSGIGTVTDSDIVIASTYEGLPVKTIGAAAFKGNTTITSVTIPNSITMIEYDAFSGCTALTSIAIPDSVTEISWYVFNECTALASATIGNGVTSIGDYAFKGCLNMKTVTFANNGINLTYMGKGVFNACRSLNAFEIPRSLTRLLFGTLSTNGGTKGGVTYQGFTSIVIPSNIKTLEDRAIYGCASLARVTFEGTPDSINSRLFENCANLTEIYVPWVRGTFADAESAWGTNGATVYFAGEGKHPYLSFTLSDDGTYYIVSDFDYGVAPTDVVIPVEYNGLPVKKLARNSMNAVGTFNSLTIPSTITEIAYSAFANAIFNAVYITDLSKWCAIDFGGTSYCNPLWNNGKGAPLYLNGSLVTDLAIPDDVTTLNTAFYCCTSIISATIPASVKSTSLYSFSRCKSLTRVIFEGTPDSIGKYAFEGCTNLTDIYVPWYRGTLAETESGWKTAGITIHFRALPTEAAVTGKIRSLITKANNTTGKSDTDLTGAVLSLAEGYGEVLEISSESEMTALLETAEVGSVYKYMGTTGTYENGALYIVEAVS